MSDQKTAELDAAILDAIDNYSNGCVSYVIVKAVAPLLIAKLVSSRLQALKKAGKVSCRGNVWKRSTAK